VLDQRRVDVTGTGYAPEGTFQDGDTPVDPHSDEHLTLALRIGALCNDAKVERADGQDTVLGDPTEAALIVAAEKAGMDHAALAAEFPRTGEVPFDSASKRMVTVHRPPHGPAMAFVKGSPGTLIAASRDQVRAAGVTPLTPEDRRRWEETNERLAGAALRVLGLAYRELPEGYSESDLARDLTFVGLVGMSDPLRDEARAAIVTCREAGIRTVMITGDQQPTAAEIARQLGIDRDLDGRPLRAVHGRELKGLDAAGWQRAVADAAVFARVSPEHKLQIVEALQQQGHVVAMTGDGVNDAPALKQADIGIAMGIKGTEIAKENADMVITDDNFASIVGAVEQGRIIYGNILRFLHYLLSCNFSEVLTVFLALMIGWPLPLVALQILWLNFITDIFPAFALALEPSAPDVMNARRATRRSLCSRRGRRPDRLARHADRRRHALRLWRRYALARDRGRRPAPRDHDGVHDAGAVPGLPRLQRPFPDAVGVRRAPVHQQVALVGGGAVPDPPGGCGLRAAAAAGAPYRPARCLGLGSDRGLFCDACRRGGAGQGDTASRDPRRAEGLVGLRM
jgi:P-type Ca2+ transporter type 2C